MSVVAGDEPKTLDFDWAYDGDASDVDHYELEVNPDGASGFTSVADASSIGQTEFTLTVAVHLTDWVNALFRVVARDADGNELASSSSIGLLNNVTSESVIGYFKASNTEVDDQFGTGIALSDDGNTLVLGARGEASASMGIDADQTDNSADFAGAIYVFVRDGTTWAQQAYIKASDPDAGDRFGSSIALSANGNTLAVGASKEDSNDTGINGNDADDSALDAGAGYVFVRNSGAWSQQAYIKASNTDSGDRFGNDVALSDDGDRLAVAALKEASTATGINGDETDNGAVGAGAVYVFERAGSNWTQDAYIKASNAAGDDRFGNRVSLASDGNTLAVSAFLEDSLSTGVNGGEGDGRQNSGAVYVLSHDGTNWSQDAYIKASNTAFDDRFGHSASVSGDGNTLAVGALREDSDATGVNGDDGNNDASDAGAAFIFVLDGGVWSQQAYIKASNTGVEDRFGGSVALSDDGDVLAVGAVTEPSAATGVNGDETDDTLDNAGAGYLFERSSGTWSQTSYLKASNTGAKDRFSRRGIVVTGNGDTLAVTAHTEASADTGVATGVTTDDDNDAANKSGAVYLY